MKPSGVRQAKAKVNPSTPRPKGLGLPSTRAQAEGLRVDPEQRFFTASSKRGRGAAEWVKKINALLEKGYGNPKRERRVDLLDVLIQTILSQNTNDRNRDRAYQRLKSRFPRWEDILNGKRKVVLEALRPGGLARQKARRIVDILQWLRKREGKVSLAFLKRMGEEEIKETLGELKGIGPKTVHCLLLFGLGREAFPVDTHILRVGKRLGFIPEEMDAEKAHSWMVPLVPKGKALSLHINLIRHGRFVCKAKKPQCADCVLNKECLCFGVVGRTSVAARVGPPAGRQ